MSEYDILIKNALIVEGTGKKPYKGALGVTGDRVTSTGNVKGDAAKVIDAKGLTAVPGFIDAHSHAERYMLWYPRSENYVMQGVTTFIGGQCGGSPAPVEDKLALPGLLEHYHHELDPYKFTPNTRRYPREQVNAWMKEKFGWTIDWRTMGEFFQRVEAKGTSVNFAPLVGHGTIRGYVMGDDYLRDSTQKERGQMHELIHQAMKDRCLGMSAGLDYDPDIFSSQQEMLEAVEQLKPYDAVYSPHWRRTGRRMGNVAARIPIAKIDSMMECVEIQRKTGVRLHFAHLDAGWAIYPPASDETDASILKSTFDRITAESKEDTDVTWNTLPFYVKGGFSVMPFLCSPFAPWLRELGSRKEFAKWLKSKDFREEVKDAVKTGKLYLGIDSSPYTGAYWAHHMYVAKHKNRKLEGKSVAEIIAERKQDGFDVWLDLIVEDPDARGARSMGVNASNYHMFYKHPSGCYALDLLGMFDDKYETPAPFNSIPGINAYSAFPILFKQMVVEEKTLTLEEAVKATSTLAARVHRLEGRGTISAGSVADIVLMDLEHLKINSTAAEPRRYPGGIEHVIINGVPVVERGKHTGATPGKVLRRA